MSEAGAAPSPDADFPVLPQVGLLALAQAFAVAGLVSFGGGLAAWIRRILVERRKWLTDEQYLSALAACQSLPGANQVNFAVWVGTELRGLPGAFAAFFGLISGPLAVMIVVGALYFNRPESAMVEAILHYLGIGAAALTVATGLDLLRDLKLAAHWVLAAVAIVTTSLLHWPLILVVPGLALAGLLLAWRRESL